ncbi:MAG TPA: MBOAT family protein [Rhodospirillaceae bacterium]|nr:MBOAT family protein [Rhodospirillaceae bacterium]
MLFNSYPFLFLFLPLTLTLFFLLGRRSHALAMGWMALASLFFYAWWSPPYLLLLLASAGFNYGAGLLLARSPPGDARRPALALAVAANLALLGYFKYADFFIQTVNATFAAGWPAMQIVLPLGISFFTFTQIAFLVDTARGEAKDYDFVHYLLFVTYFPHLIAGPILHHKEMMPQFDRPDISRFSANRLALGISVLAFGLFKKTVLADGLAAYATPVFAAAAHGGTPTPLEAWGAALAYSLQIYFDFSGYSDMAIGLARMIGIRLPLNFHSPYKAGSIIEFWRRWHMTLSRFLRDYLYFPLGGNRHGRQRRYLNLLATMVLGGLWHGAGWTFVIWGALHGLYLVVNHAWRAVRPGSAVRGRGFRLAAGMLTFLAVVVAWVPFRADGVAAARTMLAAMAGLAGPAAETATLDWTAGRLWIAAGLAIVWLAPNTQEIFARYRMLGPVHRQADRLALPWLGLRWRRSPGWALATAVIGFVGLLFFSRGSEFIYFQF